MGGRLLHLASLYVAFEVGRAWQGAAAPSATGPASARGSTAAAPRASAGPAAPGSASIALLDEISLERDAQRFEARFKGRRMNFTARLLEIDPNDRTLKLRSGGTFFWMKLDPSERVPDARFRGERVQFSGVVGALEKSGVVRVSQGAVRSR